MGLTVSGLTSSSIDVSSVVTQLMTSESIPQTRLQSQLTTVQNEAATYRAINTKFQSLLTAAQAMTDDSTWKTTTASSSSSAVTVASTGTAQAGALSFTVDQIAQAQSVISSGTPYASTGAAFGESTISFVDASNKTTSIAVGGSGTLADAVTAINAAGLGVTAAAVQVGSGQYQLQVSSKSTGVSNGFTLDGGSGWQTLSAAQDAQLELGTSASPYKVTSPTNTITGLMPGVTLTVSQPSTTPVTVTVAADPTAISNKMKAMVDAANAVLSEISADTATGVGTDGSSSGQAGVLAGDYTMQHLAQQVRTLVSSAVGSLGSPSQIGLQLGNPLDADTTDAITFDQDAFVNAIKANPDMVKQMVDGIPKVAASAGPPAVAAADAVPGIAARLAALAKNSTDSVTGTLVTLAAGDDAQAKNLTSQIDDWTTRLSLIQQQLTTTYTNMQTALSSLSNQSTWLTSMLGQLDGSSSSSSS